MQVPAAAAPGEAFAAVAAARIVCCPHEPSYDLGILDDGPPSMPSPGAAHEVSLWPLHKAHQAAAVQIVIFVWCCNSQRLEHMEAAVKVHWPAYWCFQAIGWCELVPPEA